ncbi:MAG: DUF2203 domain-containing protein [Planctomycetia bacterium]|nr:DUF2203 domain-containing protein [Planctomycetia bacterium]
MNVRPSDFKKLFTVEEANATLPLVRAICTDLAQLSRDVVERRERLASLSRPRDAQGRPEQRRDFYAEEVAQVEEELEKDAQRLQEFVDELRELGVEPKDGVAGLVDFPSLMDGRVVLLCWRMSEPEVLYWHEVDAGFAGRQPLTVDSGTAPKFGGSSIEGGSLDSGPLGGGGGQLE